MYPVHPIVMSAVAKVNYPSGRRNPVPKRVIWSGRNAIHVFGEYRFEFQS
jgi:hypothetical protein